MSLLRSQRMFSDPFYLQGIFFILYCCILLVSFCAHALVEPIWLRSSNVLFFIYFVVSWMYIDPVLIWTFAVSSIIYYLFIPGISFVAGIFLFALTLLFTFLYDMRKRSLTMFDERSTRLRRKIRDLWLKIESQTIQIERINGKIQQVGLFKKMSEAIIGKLDEQQICEHIVSYTDRIITRGDAIQLFLLEPNMQYLTLHTRHVRTGELNDEDTSDSLNRLILEQNRSTRVVDTLDDGHTGVSSECEIRSSIGAPLITADRMIGVIRVDSRQRSTFSLGDQRILSDIANFAALLISNVRLYSLTRHLAVTDGLTGLATQSALRHDMELRIADSQALSLLFIDIDDFKQINDTFGHIIGDQTLIHIAHIICETVPQGSIVSRYGGEEFVVVLQSRSQDEAASVARRVCMSVAGSMFSVRRTPITVTVSVGIAVYKGQDVTYDDIIRAADFALYQAKENGKNTYVVSNEY